MTPEQYAQEYLCSFEAAILGAYYGKEIAQLERDGRVTSSAHCVQIPKPWTQQKNGALCGPKSFRPVLVVFHVSLEYSFHAQWMSRTSR
jgi:hypothetical protein